MNPQLELLLQLQDLRMQRSELLAGADQRELEEQEFHMDAVRALENLDATIEEMQQQLKPDIRERYARILAGRGRAVVPVINGICYGCYTAIPTALAGDLGAHEAVRTCENCGRFIYILRSH